MTRTIEAVPAANTTPFESPAAARRARLSPEARAFGEEVGRNIDFRNRLRDLRLSLRLTQGQVAAIVGDEDQADISRFENGKGNPTLERMEKILGRLTEYAAARVEDAPVAQPDWAPDALVPAQAAAQYLCGIRDEEDSFSNMKLQKLLYYGQVYAAIFFRRPLFSERVIAYPHGPVIPQVWFAYKENQAQPLPRPEAFDPTALDPDARVVLERVYIELGRFEASYLRRMTHAEDPWIQTEQGKEITLEAIRAYFEPRLGVGTPAS